jgi:hypothetical protein
MAKVSVHIWHDAGGQIIAVGRTMAGHGSRLRAVQVAGKNQLVLETEADEAALKTLARTHRVDVEQRSLVEMPAREAY